MAVPDPDRPTPWPVRAIGVLLLLQSAAMVGLAVNNIAGLGVSPVQALADGSLPPQGVQVISTGLVLAALGLLGLAASIGFLLLLGFGWLEAMVLQGATLLYCLNLYFFGHRPDFIYPIMFYCGMMVLYLNSFDVQQVFRSRRREESQEEPRGRPD